MPKSRICSVDGCGKPVQARGWCSSHYYRWWWNGSGNPLGQRAERGSLPRFLFEVAIPFSDPEPCLRWPYNSVNGYGMINIDGKDRLVTRVICEHVHGTPPSDKHHAAHLCGKGHEGCCNPHHLVWKTPAENCADRIVHGTHDRGERQYASKLTESDVREIRRLKGTMKQMEIARKFKIDPSHVSDIVRRKRWSWLT